MLVGVGWNAGEGVEEGVPLAAVAIPSAEVVDAGEGCGGDADAEGGVVGELLEAAGEGGNVAWLDDKTCVVIRKKMFGSGGAGSEDGTATRHRLGHYETEALFDAGQNQNVAGAHTVGQLGLGDVAGEGYIFGGEGCEQRTEVVLHTADQGEMFARMAQAGKGFEQIGNAFAQADLAGEENLEGVGGGWFGGSEAVEADAVGDDVDFFRGDTHGEKGAARDVGANGNGVCEGVDGLFAADNVAGRRGVGETPAAMLLGHDFKLESLVG